MIKFITKGKSSRVVFVEHDDGSVEMVDTILEKSPDKEDDKKCQELESTE